MRRLHHDDLGGLVRFLRRDYANNLYFFNYLPSLKDAHPLSAIYGHYEGQNLTLAILISPAHACVTTDRPELISTCAALLPAVPKPLYVLGRRDQTLLMVRYYTPEYSAKGYILARLAPDHMPPPNRRLAWAQKATLADLIEMLEFYRGSGMLAFAEQRLPEIISRNNTRVVRYNGRIVAAAVTTTETRDMAMIGSVYTVPPYRRRGFATACVLSLCYELVTHRKDTYLFYDTHNHSVAQMYHLLGFRPTGDEWIVASSPEHTSRGDD